MNEKEDQEEEEAFHHSVARTVAHDQWEQGVAEPVGLETTFSLLWLDEAESRERAFCLSQG